MPNLIVTEKPSTSQAIAKVLGITKRRDGYLEGEEYLISWCVGHLVELAPPGSYDPKLVKWSTADLPILPKTWQYLVSPGTQKQFEVLRSLMARPDVDQLVCATDAGREGELIFPACLSPVWLCETLYPALDQQHGGCRHPGWICPPEALNRIRCFISSSPLPGAC